jgi:hypothetical protein
MGDDHIDTVISHVRSPISISHIDLPYRYRIISCHSVLNDPAARLLCITLAISSGAAMTLVNNMDAISAAAASPASAAAALVSLFSVCNCLGRVRQIGQLRYIASCAER